MAMDYFSVPFAGAGESTGAVWGKDSPAAISESPRAICSARKQNVGAQSQDRPPIFFLSVSWEQLRQLLLDQGQEPEAPCVRSGAGSPTAIGQNNRDAKICSIFDEYHRRSVAVRLT
jgi:hypothetical protein